MSNKKSLLTESEIRRFMKLANIPALNENMYGEGGGQIPQDDKTRRPEAVRPGDEDRMEEMGMPSMEEEDQMPEDAMGGEEMMDASGVDSKEEKMSQIIDLLDELVPGIIQKDMGGEVEVGAEPSGDEGMPELDDAESEEEVSDEEESEEEESEEEEEELEEAYAEKEKKEEGLYESKLVDTVLARVTARLIAEAKKKKAGSAAAKKKEDMKKKAAEMKKKKEGY